jgi:hypothetical protein
MKKTQKTQAEKNYKQFHNWKDQDTRLNPPGSKDRLKDPINIFQNRKDL